MKSTSDSVATCFFPSALAVTPYPLLPNLSPLSILDPAVFFRVIESLGQRRLALHWQHKFNIVGSPTATLEEFIFLRIGHEAALHPRGAETLLLTRAGPIVSGRPSSGAQGPCRGPRLAPGSPGG